MPTELVQQTGRRRESRPEPIADRDEFDLACLVQRDQVLEVNLAHAANAKRAKSQPVAIHVKDSIGRNRTLRLTCERRVERATGIEIF